ncbi:hypothetical protein [Streptomyces albipurpureus]|uniref:Uncharacterized protein n=1 Tax=Streptomyces albipurpureus TaxID=2897419 RepID=A0ABT0UNC0_9ACTN|nr:hypothetical protein [Streptomyces sp. CWNU-1]MCM2388898.1 hypothetical protein [Streptomyces sp. CWNU-1]
MARPLETARKIRRQRSPRPWLESGSGALARPFSVGQRELGELDPAPCRPLGRGAASVECHG